MRSSKDRQLRAAGATYENTGDRRVTAVNTFSFASSCSRRICAAPAIRTSSPRRELQECDGGEGANAHSAQRIPPQEGTPSHPTAPMTKTEKRYACWVALAPIPFMHARSLHMKSPI